MKIYDYDIYGIYYMNIYNYDIYGICIRKYIYTIIIIYIYIYEYTCLIEKNGTLIVYYLFSRVLIFPN